MFLCFTYFLTSFYFWAIQSHDRQVEISTYLLQYNQRFVDIVDNQANVAYQEVDLPVEFVCQFHRYIPNVYFSSTDNHATRSDVFCCMAVTPDTAVVFCYTWRLYAAHRHNFRWTRGMVLSLFVWWIRTCPLLSHFNRPNNKSLAPCNITF